MTDPANAASREARAYQAEFLRDLAARIFHHAADLKQFDQGDNDQLYVIATALADEAASQPQCTYCDGTGDVHRADGEWLGTCPCAAASQPREGVEAIAAKEARRVCVEYRLNPQEYEAQGLKHPLQSYIEDGIRRAVAALHDTAPTDQAQGGEVERLMAELAKLKRPSLYWIDEDPESGYTDPWEATEAALYSSDDEGVVAIREGRELGIRFYARLRSDDEIGIDNDWLRDFDTLADAQAAIDEERQRRVALAQNNPTDGGMAL